MIVSNKPDLILWRFLASLGMTWLLDGYYGEEVAIRDTNQQIKVFHMRIATSSLLPPTNRVIPSRYTNFAYQFILQLALKEPNMNNPWRSQG